MNTRVCWAALALLLVGCSKPKPAEPPAKPSTPPPAATPIPTAPDEGAAAVPLAMDMPGERPIEAKVAPYTVSASLAEVANLAEFNKLYRLTKEQRDLLQRNLFVCMPTDYRQFCFLYDKNNYANLPSFVSADAMLQLYHIFYMATLREVETAHLVPSLRRLMRGMYLDSVKTWNETKSGPLRGAAAKNVAFFAVAMQALGEKIELPTEVAPLVDVERQLVAGHAGPAVGAIFPYKVDYSVLVPRGHYTRTPELKQYFVAMAWLGTAPFALTYDGPNGTVRADEQIQQSLLIVQSLYRNNLDAEWMRIYEPTAFYVGSADDLTPAEWRTASDTVYGRQPAAADFADAAKLDQFVAEVKKLRPARIAPKLVLEKTTPETDRQFRFMGQRYILDSEVLQNLTAIDRPMPSGLDALAAIGSPRAAAILDAHADIYNPKGWAAYKPTRDKIVDWVARVTPETWTTNLYWNWLHVLRPLLAPVPEGYPSFMRSEAWADKSVHTALASWAELRHDAILYAKPSVSEMGDGDDRPMPKGYVEPNMRFWMHLMDLTLQSKAGLAKRGLVTDHIKSKFEAFLDLIKFLRTCSEKELRNQALSLDDNQRLRAIGGELEFMTLQLMPNSPNDWSLVTPVDRDMAVIADVHTAAPDCLEVGVGRANEMLVIVPIEGKLYLTRGAVFSYHEFTHPANDRLTDEKWQKMLQSGKKPGLPVWTNSFLLPTPSKPVRPGTL